MADFSEDESDPEMAEDLEEDVPELEELFESEESEENATLIGPAEDEAQGEALFDLEVEPATVLKLIEAIGMMILRYKCLRRNRYQFSPAALKPRALATVPRSVVLFV